MIIFMIFDEHIVNSFSETTAQILMKFGSCIFVMFLKYFQIKFV